MKNFKRIVQFAAIAACAPIFIATSCEVAVAMEGHKVATPAGGYFSDADTIKSEGGVGNYLFRYIKQPKSTEVSAIDEFSYSSQSSAVRADEKAEKKLFFKHDSAELSDGGVRKIDAVANDLKENPSKTINIEGYADATGPEEYNVNLSERRAQAVVDELKSKGVSTAQLRWQGKGIEDPIGNNATENGRMKNRRVEIKEE